MRLATSTNILFNRPDGTKADIKRSIRSCAEAGFTVLDVNFIEATQFPSGFQGDHWERWVDELGQLAADLEVSFGQGHAPSYNFCDSAIQNGDWLNEMIRRSVIAAGTLGIGWLVTHAATDFAAVRSVRASQKANLDYFAPFLDLASGRGLGIAFENLWEIPIAPLRRYTSSVEELLDLVDAFDSDRVGICWDFGHADHMKQDQIASLRAIGSRLRATHVSDSHGVSADHLVPYFGHLDWPALIVTLAEIDYNGDLTYECHRHLESVPDALVPAGLRYARDVGEYLLSLDPRAVS